MQYSVVDFNEINLGDRIDAEYFEPEFLAIGELLTDKKALPLRNYCKITTSAFYPAATDLYKIGDVPFIRCVDIVNFPLISDYQNQLFEKIPTLFLNENKTVKKIKKGDITISKVGTPCYASIIHNIDEVALSRTVLGLTNISGLDPYYLTAYLRSKYGFKQLLRERELTIQYQLTLDRVGNVLIYKPKDKKFEEAISDIFRKSFELSAKAQNSYNYAKSLLLNALNLSDWKPRHQLSFTRSFKEVDDANRIDAEYFQPMYDEIINAVKAVSYDKLGELVTYTKGEEVGTSAYTEDGVPFIRVSDVSEKGIERTEKTITESLYHELSATHSPRKGDVLMTKDGTIGKAFVMHENVKAILSGAFLKLRPKKDVKLDREYLALVINSLICKQQIKKMAGGAIIAHLKPSDAMNLVIPLLDETIQAEISAKIAKSRKSLEQSKALLETAKRGVEMAIEQDETSAKQWMEKRLQILEV